MATNTMTTNTSYEFIKKVCDSICNIEKQYAKSLFEKYIKNTIAHMTPEEQHDSEVKYMNMLFIVKKPMTADNYLLMELNEIEQANADYFADPKAYPSKKTEHGYPDEYRCNFIRQDKTLLKRCASKAIDEEFYCSQHMNTPNKFLREYEKAVAELQN